MVPTLRKELRVPVSGTITYSFGDATYRGTVKNVSIHGCQAESPQPPPFDTLVSYSMHLPEMDGPLVIRRALVQWVSQNEFGLKTLDMPPDTLKCLRRFLDDSYLQMARARRERRTSPSPPVSDGPPGGAPATSAVGLAPAQEAQAAEEITLRIGREGGEESAIRPQELSMFVEWILDARRALHDGTPLPVAPTLACQELEACAQFLQGLLDQHHRGRAQDRTRAHSPAPGRGTEPANAPSGAPGLASVEPPREHPAGPRRRRSPRSPASPRGEVTGPPRWRLWLKAAARQLAAFLNADLSSVVRRTRRGPLRLPR